MIGFNKLAGSKTATEVLILGAGGHGKVVADVLRSDGRYHILGFVDPAPTAQGQAIIDLPVLGDDSVVQAQYPQARLIIAIGDNSSRLQLAEMLSGRGREFVTGIHSSAVVSPYAHLDLGIVVMPNAVVNAHANIGAHAILNTGCIVEHDCCVGKAVHVSIGACLCGRVVVGEKTMIGAGSTILPGVHIGARSVVGAGAVVVSDLPDDVAAVGVPAKIIKYVRSDP